MCDDFLHCIHHDFCKFFLFVWIIGQPVGCLSVWVCTWPSEVNSYVKYFHRGFTSALHGVTEPVTKSICHIQTGVVAQFWFLWFRTKRFCDVQMNFIYWFPAVSFLMIFMQIFLIVVQYCLTFLLKEREFAITFSSTRNWLFKTYWPVNLLKLKEYTGNPVPKFAMALFARFLHYMFP
jgi:hypothetical protein